MIQKTDSVINAPLLGDYIIVTNTSGVDKSYIKTSRGIVDVTSQANIFSRGPVRFQLTDIVGMTIYTQFHKFGYILNNGVKEYIFVYGPQHLVDFKLMWYGAYLKFVDPPAKVSPFNLGNAPEIDPATLPDIDTSEAALKYQK